jgi:hypothetical protein
MSSFFFEIMKLKTIFLLSSYNKTKTLKSKTVFYRNSKILIKYCILLFHLTSEIPYHDLTITRKIQGHPLCAYILEISRVKELVLNTLEFTQKFFCIISHGYVI